MKKTIDKFLTSLANIHYLSAWVVLAIDLFLSTLGTIVALLLIGWITIHSLSVKLMILALVVSFVASALVFCSLRTYRKAIRHTTLTDVGLLGISALFKCLITYLFLLAILRDAYGLRFLFFCGIADGVFTFSSLYAHASC